MSKVSVMVPSVGTEAYFSFKEPFNVYVSNKFNINTNSIKLKVISVISMRDAIRTDLRDPFIDIYDKVGLSEINYKLDLGDEIPLISFSYKDQKGVEKYIRVPLNYIAEVSGFAGVDYSNRVLVLDLGDLPVDLDISGHYGDIKDYVATLLGVSPNLKDVSIGDIKSLSDVQHKQKEQIRNNNVSVHKTLTVQLREVTESRDQILNRLDTLGIVLG